MATPSPISSEAFYAAIGKRDRPELRDVPVSSAAATGQRRPLAARSTLAPHRREILWATRRPALGAVLAKPEQETRYVPTKETAAPADAESKTLYVAIEISGRAGWLGYCGLPRGRMRNVIVGARPKAADRALAVRRDGLVPTGAKLVIDRLDKARAKYADLILVHGGAYLV